MWPRWSARAGAALVARELPLAIPQIVVRDTLAALQTLARAWLEMLDVRRVALTGSNGKTTTKALTAAILVAGRPTWATPGNYNNEIGVPLTVLGLRSVHQYAVIEMGAGKPGDIDELTRSRAAACGCDHQHRAGAPGAPGQRAGRGRGQGRHLPWADRGWHRRDQCRRHLGALLPQPGGSPPRDRLRHRRPRRGARRGGRDRSALALPAVHAGRQAHRSSCRCRAATT
jgi:hypothetical protein